MWLAFSLVQVFAFKFVTVRRALIVNANAPLHSSLHSAPVMLPSSMKRKRTTTHYSPFNTPALESLSVSFDRHARLLQDGLSTCLPFFAPGSLEQLSLFAQRNGAVAGLTLGAVFHKVLGCGSNSNGDGMQADHFYSILPTKSLVTVSFQASNTEQLSRVISSDSRTVISSSKGTTKIGSEWTIYGIAFDLEIRWTFKNAAGESHEETFNSRIRVEPKPSQITPMSVHTPKATEFDLGAAIDLMHASSQIDAGSPCMAPWANLSDDQRNSFPRHNPAVENAEAAFAEMGRFVDMHTRFIGPYLPAVIGRQSQVAIPWSMAIPVKEPQPTVIMDASLSGMMKTFVAEQGGTMLGLQTRIGDLVQWLVLLKALVVHFGFCFERIDDVMVRAFFKSIGKTHEQVFEGGFSLDEMLRDIGYYQMDRADMTLSEVAKTYTGCSIAMEMRFADGTWERLIALPHEDPKFRGEIAFGGIGCAGLPVHGHETRYLFIEPTDECLRTLPEFRLVGSTEFANVPIAVILGTPDGSKTKAGGIFLFVDGMNFRLALNVAALPSNKSFKKSVASLPKEFAAFASAIRACDLANSGIDVHVVLLRPMLAHACGIPVSELAGQRKFEGELINVMRAGCSLASLSQRVNPDTDWEAVPSPSGDALAGSPSYDIALLKSELRVLSDEVFARGAVDNAPVAPPPPEVVVRHVHHYDDTPVFRSLGAAGEDDEPHYTDMGAGAVSEPPPVATDAAETTKDPAVDELCGSLKAMATDRDFMKTVLNALDSMDNPDAITAAKLSMPNLAEGCLFADNIHPKDKGGDVKGPADDAFGKRNNFNSSSDALVSLLTNYGQSILTTRFTVFGVFAIWEKNLLTKLMSGGQDPSALMLNVANKLRPLQMS